MFSTFKAMSLYEISRSFSLMQSDCFAWNLTNNDSEMHFESRIHSLHQICDTGKRTSRESCWEELVTWPRSHANFHRIAAVNLSIQHELIKQSPGDQEPLSPIRIQCYLVIYLIHHRNSLIILMLWEEEGEFYVCVISELLGEVRMPWKHE